MTKSPAKPARPAKAAAPAVTADAAPAPAARPALRVTRQAIAQAKSGRATTETVAHPYELPTAPPGTFPPGEMAEAVHAMDYDPGIAGAYEWAGSYAVHEGLAFLGYPYLAELTQRPEYRRASEIMAKEMTRKWIKLTSTSSEDNSAKRKELERALEAFRVRDLFRRAAEQDGFFGRSHIYVDTGKGDDSKALQAPLIVDKRTIKQGSVKGFKVIEPVWVYPNAYNTSDPLHPHYYRPQSWFVQGKLIHTTRLLTFVSREVPDLLKPAYSFGGLSLSQMGKPYVDNWLRTRQSVSDLISNYSKDVLATNLAGVLAGGGADEMVNRADLYTQTADNRGVRLIDKESEEFANVATPLGTLDKLQSQAQEQMASVWGIPLVVLLGVTPSGLNASSDGEIRVFYAWIKAQQEHTFDTNLHRVLQIVQLHLWGEVDDSIGFIWNDLWEEDQESSATNRKTDAETDTLYVEASILHPDEVRTRLARDEESPYFGLDLNREAPEPPEADVPDDSDGGEPGEGGEPPEPDVDDDPDQRKEP